MFQKIRLLYNPKAVFVNPEWGIIDVFFFDEISVGISGKM